MGMQDIITTKLLAAFAPESLHVEDESHLHEGHAGHRPGGESHFRLYIVSEAFRGKSRLERHRMINAALANELKGRVHALAIHAQAPGESVKPLLIRDWQAAGASSSLSNPVRSSAWVYIASLPSALRGHCSFGRSQ